MQATEYPKWIKYLSGKTSRVVIKSSSLWKLSPFLNDGSIRVGERLGNAVFSYETKHLIILPKNSLFTFLAIKHHHWNKVAHSGIKATLNLVRWPRSNASSAGKVFILYSHGRKTCATVNGKSAVGKIAKWRTALHSHRS